MPNKTPEEPNSDSGELDEEQLEEAHGGLLPAAIIKPLGNINTVPSQPVAPTPLANPLGKVGIVRPNC